MQIIDFVSDMIIVKSKYQRSVSICFVSNEFSPFDLNIIDVLIVFAMLCTCLIVRLPLTFHLIMLVEKNEQMKIIIDFQVYYTVLH